MTGAILKMVISLYLTTNHLISIKFVVQMCILIWRIVK